MGKKDKNKKKGAGAAKTAEKTEKKAKAKIKKVTGEVSDIYLRIADACRESGTLVS